MKAALTVILFFAALSGSTSAQEPNQPLHPGVSLFQQGKFSEAVRSLEVAVKSKEHKDEAEIWNYLGLAYLAETETQKGVKALEKSVKLKGLDAVFRANLAYAHLLAGNFKKAREQANKVIELDPRNEIAYQVRSTVNLREHKLEAADHDADAFISYAETNPEAYILKSTIAVSIFGMRVEAGSKTRDEAGLLKNAMDVLEAGIAKVGGKASPQANRLEREFEEISVFYQHFTGEPLPPGATPAPQPPGVEPYRILAKPRAKYTDRARARGVEGSIRVSVLLGTSGKVDHVLFLRRLGDGLDEAVLEAIQGIRFEPKKVNGKPVPVVVTLEYSFEIY